MTFPSNWQDMSKSVMNGLPSTVATKNWALMTHPHPQSPPMTNLSDVLVAVAHSLQPTKKAMDLAKG